MSTWILIALNQSPSPSHHPPSSPPWMPVLSSSPHSLRAAVVGGARIVSAPYDWITTRPKSAAEPSHCPSFRWDSGVIHNLCIALLRLNPDIALHVRETLFTVSYTYNLFSEGRPLETLGVRTTAVVIARGVGAMGLKGHLEMMCWSPTAEWDV